MAVLWAGGEDIDFPSGTAINVDTGGHYRTGYARCSMWHNTNPGYTQSYPFKGGAVTSAWLSCQYAGNDNGTGYTNPTVIGFGKSGTNKGLYIGVPNSFKLSIVKFDGTTATTLATQTGSSEPEGTPPPMRLDMQVISYGATATVNVYLAGALIITYTGDVTVSGMTNFDCVALGRNGTTVHWLSEIIVADESTLNWAGLVTMSPTGAGTTDAWSGAYTDVNEISVNNATSINSSTTGQDEQFNLTDLPAGTFNIKGVVCTANAAVSTGTAPTKIALGFNSGGSVAVATAQSPSLTVFAPITEIFATNPVTSVAFTQSEMNALQINLRAAA